jgi:hypothetical protein
MCLKFIKYTTTTLVSNIPSLTGRVCDASNGKIK